MQVASSIDDIMAAILGVPFHKERRARLIAISGIDGSGKGYVSTRLAEKLADKGFRVCADCCRRMVESASCPLRG
jgi:predicted ATPase